MQNFLPCRKASRVVDVIDDNDDDDHNNDGDDDDDVDDDDDDKDDIGDDITNVFTIANHSGIH